MGNKQARTSSWGGVAGGAVLEHLLASISAVSPCASQTPSWRDDVLADLGALRDVLIAERPAAPRGAPVIRERSQLLSEMGRQRLQVLTSSDVDRVTYDLRRLADQLGAHLGRAQTTAGRHT